MKLNRHIFFEMGSSRDYAAFQKTHVLVDEKASWPLLVVEAASRGESFDMVEREFSAVISRNSDVDVKGYATDGRSGARSEAGISGSASTTTEASSYRDYGQSAYYPMNQKVRINGKEYGLYNEDVFYNAKIRPGVVNIEFSFDEGYWDAKINQQRKGRTHKKSFSMRMEEKRNIKIVATFISNQNTQDIGVKMYRMK